MKKYLIGIIFGVIAGIINCLFLLFAKDLDCIIYVSNFIIWVITGLLISSVDFKVNSLLKGAFVSLLTSSSSLIYTFANNMFGGIWTICITMLIGSFIGLEIDKKCQKSNSKNF